MFRILLILTFVFSVGPLWSQSDSLDRNEFPGLVRNGAYESDLDTLNVVHKPEIKANFPGGQEALIKFITERFQYPERCKNDGIDGYVQLRFLVSEVGDISYVNALKQSGACPEFAIEATRVMKCSPLWVPAQNEGKFVKSWFVLPIKLDLQK